MRLHLQTDMKKFWIALFIGMLIPVKLSAQNFTLTINSSGIKADSIHFQRFTNGKEFKDTLAIPFSSKVIFKLKESIAPGQYQVLTDTNLLFELLISDKKKQAINVQVQANGEIIFENSVENSNWVAYNKRLMEFNAQRESLNQQYEQAQKSMPAYMLETFVQKLIAQDEAIQKEETAYKDQVIAENPSTLLASIVAFSKALPTPPQNIQQNRQLLLEFYTQHDFDYYPFEDERLLNSPYYIERLREFCAKLLYMEPSTAGRYATALLTKAQISPKTYHVFFDRIEKTFGQQGTPYYNEPIYLEILKNALNYSQLDKEHTLNCQREYNLHTLNLAGNRITDFDVQWSDGSHSKLTDVESDFILLYFQNPDCPECTLIRGYLAENKELNKAIESGKLKVITIYFEHDKNLWERYLKEKADPNYMHGWDYKGEIDAKNLYDLRAIPYMFLLDKDKKIIKKDLIYSEISDYLKQYKIVE